MALLAGTPVAQAKVNLNGNWAGTWTPDEGSQEKGGEMQFEIWQDGESVSGVFSGPSPQGQFRVAGNRPWQHSTETGVDQQGKRDFDGTACGRNALLGATLKGKAALRDKARRHAIECVPGTAMVYFDA